MSSQDISNPGSEQSNDVSKIKIKETEKKYSESNRIPDGGWAWMVVFGSFMCNVVLGNILFYLCMMCSMENIGGGMAAPLKSAVGPIWLGRRLE